LNIFEDIYSPTISGTINIVDTKGIIQDLPLSGTDFIDIEYETPGFASELKVSSRFVIFKITDRVVLNTHKQMYNIHFMSEEAHIDTSTKLSKAYKGSASSVANNILNTIGSKKKRFFSEGSNNITFVSPFWSPFKIINYYTSNSVNPLTKFSNFVFYETVRGFILTSLDYLFKKEPKVTYFYDANPRRTESGSKDIIAEWSAISDIHFFPPFDNIERVTAGMYENMSYIHDITSKSLNVLRYKYQDSFKKEASIHLGNYPLVKPLEVNPRIVTHKNIMNLSHPSMDYDLTGVNKNSRIPLLYDLEMLRIDITVHGRTDISAGDIVKFNMLRFKEVAGDTGLENRDDMYYTGKYIVTSVNHRIASNKHEMILQLSKNASERDLYE
jgi:hypothetical protein